MKLKLQGMTDENLSVVTYQRMNLNIGGTFINMLEKMLFTEHFLKHKASGKVILFLDGYRAPYHCYRLLLKIKLQSFVYRVTVLVPYSLWMRAFFFGL